VTNKEQKIAQNYAKILFLIYSEPYDWRLLLDKLEKIECLVSAEKGRYLFASLGLLNKNRGLMILDKFAKAAELDNRLLLFLKFVFSCKRFYLLPQILVISKELLFVKMKTEKCNVFSSHSLTDDQLLGLKNYFSKLLDKNLNLEFSLKKRLILGLQVMTKKYIFESSFADKLQQIIVKLNSGILNEE